MATAIALEERKKRNKILGEDFYKDDEQTHQEGIVSQKEKINKTTKGLTNDLLLGVIGGGLAGAVLGKYSFFAGLALAGYGHYSDNKLLGTVGLGIMASGTASALLGGKAQDPKLSQMEKVTERVKGFASELKRKVWIDKWDSPDGLNGIGNTNSKTVVKEKMDFSKKAEPIDHTKYSKLSKEEEQELDKYLENATINGFNQFYEKRHNVNGVNDEQNKEAVTSTGSVTNEEKAIKDLENEFAKATNDSSNKTNQNHSQSSTTHKSDISEDNLSGNIEDFMSDDLKKEFYKNQSLSTSASTSKSSKNKNWENEFDVADKLF